MNTYTTTEVARIIGIHPNTVQMKKDIPQDRVFLHQEMLLMEHVLLWKRLLTVKL